MGLSKEFYEVKKHITVEINDAGYMLQWLAFMLNWDVSDVVQSILAYGVDYILNDEYNDVELALHNKLRRFYDNGGAWVE